MAFRSYLTPSTKRPRAQVNWQKPAQAFVNSLRQNFHLTTLLLIGALLQSLVLFIIPRFYAMLPAILILGARLADSLAITYGWKRNPYLDEAILHRVSPQIPDEDGNFHQEPAEEKVVAFMLGAKVNHPLGLFAPNVKQVGDGLQEMFKDLEDHAPENGFLGASVWHSTDKNGATELLYPSYWRSTKDLHDFAYGPVHMKTWDWWNKTIKQNDHIGILHEMFEVDRKSWEAIYVNFQPTLLGATTYVRKGDKSIGGTVDDQWISPLVDARSGKLRSSAGRLGRDPNELYEKHRLAPGGKYE
ncbi:hypothetical protein EDD37DRAFT_510762 [Exophiala viscosa]|uniref:Uncharacterized protein n=1 Tax=Exophiala viscosa TaxID=2486360 RepID=A0AAN6IF58_9EURO|nr:hypothetical protein EDD36DRAFT_179912 [Exophiala viscosa]KAI1622213.1 hypothetical protein EDD37DRAFT_510762 [Exophiala viscosa]